MINIIALLACAPMAVAQPTMHMQCRCFYGTFPDGGTRVILDQIGVNRHRVSYCPTRHEHDQNIFYTRSRTRKGERIARQQVLKPTPREKNRQQSRVGSYIRQNGDFPNALFRR
ncbi:uncharacterized protein B0H64DRAFT_389235 [Chaetomium fimeti]|uniref:Secreted protein n=1 Tax=Chaetomium fimeti TaxID=1854472 RepID=A0AAE0HN76_9PEZI|nr:hypothetical protein B0H64DRAFT_389235 [Chaetomium fimeti]